MDSQAARHAERRCRERLAANPDDADALFALALIVRPADPASALSLLDRCLAADPSRTDTLFERGNLLRALGRNRDAVRDYAALLQRDAGHFRALTNLGNALREFGELPAALRCYERAIAAGGDLPVVRLNRAIVIHQMGETARALELLADLRRGPPPLAEAAFESARLLAGLGRTDEALQCFDEGFALRPGDARALNSRGNLHAEHFRARAALADYDAALRAQPDFHEALNNRANQLRNLGRFDEALADYDRALALRPGIAQVLVNRGNVLNDMGRLRDALDSLQQAIDIDPRIPQAYLHAGRIHADLARLVQADRLFDHALALKPDLWEVWFYKGAGLREMGAHAEALQCFRRILEANPEEVNLAALGNYLFSMNFDDGVSSDDYLSQAKLFGQLVARRVSQRFTHPEPARAPASLRIGLVSGDLKRHPVGFFLQNLLEHLQGGRLQLFAYANDGDHDELSERLKNCCAGWRVVPALSDRQLATCIRDDGIDILIDLSGHTDKSRLPVFAWKPARVQVTWLGYCASTGINDIDYVLGDRIVTPLVDAPAFVERIWQMPDNYFCFTPLDTQLPVAPLPALANGFVTFGCFNKLSKVSDTVIATWARLLHALPDARLLLKTAVLADAVTRQETLQRFARHGIDANRLLFEGSSSYENYLGAYARIDIALDPFPYPGATTTLEGLWMGVPCVTMQGRRFLARNGETIAFHAGLQDFIASGPDDYVARALAIASDLPALAVLRAGLREQMRASPLFDGRRFARHFEQAMFDIWEAGPRPASNPQADGDVPHL